MALMDDILFNIPDKMKEKNITIEKELVVEKMSNIVKNRDLSRYIL
jgi:ATP-dependent HslUV protease ATP-binding subunit HslU